MKKGIFVLFLIWATGSATTVKSTEVLNANYVPEMKLDQIVETVGQLRLGMSERQAVAILETNGFRKVGMNIGDSFFWSIWFNMSEVYQLRLDCVTSLRDSDDKRENGVVRRIYVSKRNEGTSIFEVVVGPAVGAEGQDSGGKGEQGGGLPLQAAHVTWVRKCQADFKEIKPGMTRAEVEQRLRLDGAWRKYVAITYVHPECPHFKIDVEFSAKKDPDDPNRVVTSPDDKAVTVSKPYIEDLRSE